jgi:hypothetical protein
MTLARFAADTPAGIVLVDVLNDTIECSEEQEFVEFSAFAQVNGAHSGVRFRFILTAEHDDPTDPQPESVVSILATDAGQCSPLDVVGLFGTFRVPLARLESGWYHVFLDQGTRPVTQARLRIEILTE